MLSTDRHVAPLRSLAHEPVERMASTMRYYEANASAYAATTKRIDVSERITQFADLLPRGGRVLDAGCGAGRDLRHFREAGLNAIGLDLSPRLTAIARGTSGCEVLVGDLVSPPPLAPFDGIWAMASLLHIYRDAIGEALAALASLLKPGGVLFASVKRGQGDVIDDDGRWFTLFDESQWASHLQRAGLEIIEIIGEPPARSIATGSVAPGWISSLARRV